MASRSLSFVGLVILLLAGLVPGGVRARPGRALAAGRRAEATGAACRTEQAAAELAVAGSVMPMAAALPGAAAPLLRPAVVASRRVERPGARPAPAPARVRLSSRAPPFLG